VRTHQTIMVPIMTMMDPKKGMVDYHYGNNIYAPAGSYTVRVRVNRVRAAFSVTLHSTEPDQTLVRKLYWQYLRRPADSQRLGFLVNDLQQGARDETIIDALVGSDEYLAKS
jgi:hypothetical protein